MTQPASPATNGADDFSRLSMEEVGRKALEIRSCLVDIYGTPPLLLDALGKLENRFQELKALPSATEQMPAMAKPHPDTERLDWLEMMDVEVRTPLVHGSHHLFFSVPELGDGTDDPSDIRRKIDYQRNGGSKP